MRYFIDTEFAEDGRSIDLISVGIVAEDGREFYAVSTEFDADRCNDWVRANVLPRLPPRDAADPGSVASLTAYSPSSRERAHAFGRLGAVVGRPEPPPSAGPRHWATRAQIAEALRAFLRPHDPAAEPAQDAQGTARGICSRCDAKIERAGLVGTAWEPWLHGDIDAPCAGECPGAPEPELWGYYAAYDHVALCQLYGRMIDLPKGWPMFALDVNQWRRQLSLPREALPPNPADEHNALADARWIHEAYKILANKMTNDTMIETILSAWKGKFASHATARELAEAAVQAIKRNIVWQPKDARQ